MILFQKPQVTGRSPGSQTSSNINVFYFENRAELCIVVLCYKSGSFAKDYLESILDALRKGRITGYEILLVGNYVEESKDDTPEIVRGLCENFDRVSCITLPKKGWLGWDVRKAFEATNANYAALIDGDGQMPAEDIPKAFLKIIQEDYDLVLTYRTKRGDGMYRFLLSLSYNFTVKILFPRVSVKDINSKPKIIRSSLLESMQLESNGWTIDAEIMLQAFKRKARIHEIPTEFHGQTGGRKSFVGYKAIIEFILFLIKQRFLGIK